MADSNQCGNIRKNYLENVKNVSENIRYKRMMGVFETTTEIKTEQDVIPQQIIDNNVLQPLLKSCYVNDVLDLICEDDKMAAAVMKCCPYGSDLSEDHLTSIEKLMPEAMKRMKQALAKANGVDDVK